MSSASSHISNLSSLANKLEKRYHSGIPIPDDFLQEIIKLNQKVEAFLQESQKQFDSSERNESIKKMVLLIWSIFFNNVIQKIVQDHSEFPIYHTCMADKDHAKCVMADDIREKIRLLHEMLESWPHLVPPQLKDINFPAGHLQNQMLYASYDDGIEPRVGFVELPSLKPNIEPLSIIDYIAFEYEVEEDYIKDTTVLCFVRFAKDRELEYVYDPSENDPTFLSDVMERYGSTRYLEVCEMFPNLISIYHPRQ